jgi:hypothetical protein
MIMSESRDEIEVEKVCAGLRLVESQKEELGSSVEM